MSECCCCFFYLQENQQAVVTSLGDKALIEGPAGCSCFNCLTSSVEVVNNIDLSVNQQMVILNENDVDRTRYEFGPKLVKLSRLMKELWRDRLIVWCWTRMITS